MSCFLCPFPTSSWYFKWYFRQHSSLLYSEIDVLTGDGHVLHCDNTAYVTRYPSSLNITSWCALLLQHLLRETYKASLHLCTGFCGITNSKTLQEMKITGYFLAFRFWQIFFLDINETQFGDKSRNKLELLPPGQVEY